MENNGSNQAADAKPSHYVGIGASAGGLEAIESFFTNMPAQNKLAFIIVQHLSPDYKSLMVELLSKKTEMPVHRAENGMEVAAGNVYLIPPKKNLTIFHGKLIVEDKSNREGINLPIDIFLQSLAEDQEEKAIAVILSGTGSDGARGVRAVKEHNGMVVVQEEASAKFNGMPRAAISTGATDFILPTDKMPSQLLSYIAHPYISGAKQADSLLNDSNALTRLFAELRARTKVDFTYYKPSTITRRIERRMSINQITDFEEYVRYLQHFPGEAAALYRELLIGVTSFFRDSDAMEELRNTILPSLCQAAKGRELRCWITGCSSGEEAYTLAILFKEVMELLGTNQDIKIFATDVDREAIIKASTGIYQDSIAGDLPQHILAKYFYRKEDSYQIARNIREMVVFAQHNIIKDPPFTNIDLVSCRNLLIYLQPVLQERVLESFNFSLRSGGILFLGNSETIGEMTDYFKPLHNRYRIYQSRGKTIQLRGPVTRAGKDKPVGNFFGRSMPRRTSLQSLDKDPGVIQPYLQSLGNLYFKLSVIVNERLEIEHIIGNSEGFFTLPSGPLEYNITKLASRDLAIPLATGIQKVFRTGKTLSYSNLQLQYRPSNQVLSLKMVPLENRKGQVSFVAVFIEETETAENQSSKTINYDLSKDAQQRIKDLELELQFARENLQATIEELETSNEELQATNEELMASNEELQSTNEELQSTNEELYTVNAEHQNKIIELTQLSNDVDNLLTSSKIGTLIVDENLEIRKFSPEINNIFNILEKDIGRPFSHISHFFDDVDPVEAVQKVLENKESIQFDAQTKNGNWYLTRIMPYVIGPSTYSGTVLTFVDITELKLAKSAKSLSERQSSELSDNIPVGLFIYKWAKEGHLIFDSCNKEGERLTGVSAEQCKGMKFTEIWPEAENLGLCKQFQQVLETGKTCAIDQLHYSDKNLSGIFKIRAFCLPEKKLAISFEDITSQLNTSRKLEQSEIKFKHLFDTMNLGVVYQNMEGEIISANPAAEKILELNLEEMKGRTSDDRRWQAITTSGAPLPGEQHPSMISLKTGRAVNGFIMGIYSSSTDTTKWLSVNATPQYRNKEKKPYQVFTTFEDITNRVVYEQRLKRTGKSLADAMKKLNTYWWVLDLENDRYEISSALTKDFGIVSGSRQTFAAAWREKVHLNDFDEVERQRQKHINDETDRSVIRYRLAGQDTQFFQIDEQIEAIEWETPHKPRLLIGLLTQYETPESEHY